jgi:uncharacterized protein (DUF1778 family)
MQILGNGHAERPPKPAIQRRSEFLKIRLSTGERIDLAEAAERLGKSVSEFVRDAAMHQAGIVRSVLS